MSQFVNMSDNLKKQHDVSILWPIYLNFLNNYVLSSVKNYVLRYKTWKKKCVNFWSLGISRRTYGFALVRPSIRDTISGDPRIRFFWNLAQSCILARLKNVPSGFLKKISFAPQGVLTPKPPFLAENGLLSLYLQNRASDFDDFCTDVRDSCPEWFGLSAVC